MIQVIKWSSKMKLHTKSPLCDRVGIVALVGGDVAGSVLLDFTRRPPLHTASFAITLAVRAH